MPIDKKTKAYSIYQKIVEHFKDHHYLTLDDLEQFNREEYQSEIRRNLPVDEGASSLDVDFEGASSLNIEFIDLP